MKIKEDNAKPLTTDDVKYMQMRSLSYSLGKVNIRGLISCDKEGGFQYCSEVSNLAHKDT